MFCLGIGSYCRRTNANELLVEGRSLLRNLPTAKPDVSWVGLQLLFWENLWAIFQKAFRQDRDEECGLWGMTLVASIF